MKVSIFIAFIFLYITPCLFSQKTTIFTEANTAYKHGVELFELGVYGSAKLEFEKAYKLLRPLNDNQYEQLQNKAQMYYAQSAVRMDLPDGERLVYDFIRDKKPEPDAVVAVLDMGNYFYNAKKYDEAIDFYAIVDPGSLPADQRSELQFKQGYAYFVKKKFPQAKAAFASIKDVKNKYYFPTNYYYGMTAFFDGKYDDAIKSFQMISGSQKYKPHVPYYISQIYFAQKKYDDLINYASAQLDESSVQKKKEIQQLLGQAYFEKGDYKNATTNLEAAIGGSSRPEDYYQLGYALYQTQSYKRAATYLEQLSNVDSELGQTAMYLLADSYLKSNDSTKAKNAFAAASRLSHNVQIQEDALISYAKLSYETNNDQEAITAIQKIPQTSENYMKGQQLLSEICLTSRDYARAISILEQLPEKNMKMKEIYQKVLCYRGIQLVTDNNPDEAEKVFLRSNDLGIDKQTKAISTFWLADIAHQNKLYEKSSQYASQFLNIADGVSGLPNEASVYTGRYLQGYNYLKLEKYADAFTNFKECVNGIKKNKDNIIGNEYITKEVYGDAILRAGDCLFKRDNYKDAMKYYDETVNKKYTGFVYALYQKAMVQGLQGQSYDKVVSLDYIVDNYPKSEYTDDALWQLGVTYLELNKPERAIEPLRKIVNNFGGKSELVNKAYLRLGLITFNQGDNNGSITYYKKVIENNPTSNERTEALHALEEIYVKELGKPDEYFDVVETSTGTKVNEIAKDSINFNAAMAQYETGNCDKAIESFSSYINKFSKSSNALIAYNFRAECYLEKKDFTKAYSDYENVIERGQSKYFANALVKAASIAYNDKKDFAKAFEYYTKLESVANNDEMRFNAQLGAMRSAYRNKNTEGVKEMARKLTESSKASKENLSTAHYYLGKIAYDEKNNDSALASLNKCAKMVNNEFAAEARYLIADIYYQQRELDIAEKLCLKANEESAGYDFWIAKSLILVADIYAEKGDIFSARGALEALIENFKDKELVAIAKAKLAKLNNENAQVEKTVKSDVLELDEDDKN